MLERGKGLKSDPMAPDNTPARAVLLFAKGEAEREVGRLGQQSVERTGAESLG